ncbi:MAG: hypothetical protein ACRDMV_08895 [Streptosporangiales bacterium]
MSDLRDRLRTKARRTTDVPLVIDPDGEVEARRALDDARMRLRVAQIGDDDAPKAKQTRAVNDAQADIDKAQAAWEQTVERVEFQALSRPDMEALIAEHPPTKDDDDDAGWHAETFQPALVAACSTDQSMSEAEWAEFLSSDRMSVGEVNSLYEAVARLNMEYPQAGVPKG